MAEYKGKLLKGLFTQAKNVLLSDGTDVETAISSGGGSVTVAADGTKTYVQGLNELFALIDVTKLSAKSALQKGDDCFYANSILTTNIVFNSVLINSNTTINVYQYTIKSSGSKVERLVNGAYTDLSSNVMSGDLTLLY